MINYTSIEIRKTAPSTFEIYDNTSPNEPTISSSYDGLIEPFKGIQNNDNTLTITTKAGHPIYNHQRWQVYKYTDTLNGANSFIPISAIDLQRKLIARGFYDEGNIDMPVDTIVQDNIGRVKTFTYTKTERNGIQPLNIPAKINALPQFTISQLDDYHFLGLETDTAPGGLNVFTGGSLRYRFVNLGKGTYGQGGIQITGSNLDFIVERVITVQDIENDPTTQIFTYELEPNQTIWQWLNSQDTPLEIQSQDEGYTLFMGEQGTYLFIDQAGVYGTGQLQSQEASFQLFSDELPAPAPSNEVAARMLTITTPDQQDDQFISNELIGATQIYFVTEGQTITRDMFQFDASLGKVFDFTIHANQVITVIYTKP